MKLETKEEYLVDSAIEMLYPTAQFRASALSRYEARITEDGDFRAYIYAMSLKRLKRKCEKYAKRERKAIAYVATLKEES